jgi:hypothetical protein
LFPYLTKKNWNFFIFFGKFLVFTAFGLFTNLVNFRGKQAKNPSRGRNQGKNLSALLCREGGITPCLVYGGYGGSLRKSIRHYDYMHVREVKWSEMKWSPQQQQTGARMKIHDVSNFSALTVGRMESSPEYKFWLQFVSEGLGYAHRTGCVLLESKPFSFSFFLLVKFWPTTLTLLNPSWVV